MSQVVAGEVENKSRSFQFRVVLRFALHPASRSRVTPVKTFVFLLGDVTSGHLHFPFLFYRSFLISSIRSSRRRPSSRFFNGETRERERESPLRQSATNVPRTHMFPLSLFLFFF